MKNNFLRFLNPSTSEVIRTDFSLEEINRKLSQVVENSEIFDQRVTQDLRKPFEGDLSHLYFKIKKPSDEEFAPIYILGKILQDQNGYSIEITSGYNGQEFFFTILGGVVFFQLKRLYQGAGFVPFLMLFNLFIFVLLFEYMVTFAVVKQETRKQVDFIKNVILSKEKFCPSAYYKNERIELIRKILMVMGCLLFVMISLAILALVFPKSIDAMLRLKL